MTVFVVDDDLQIRKAMSRWFVLNNLKGECYSSAEAFLSQVKPNFLPGCIILDLRMEGMSGLELQRCLKERMPHWPIIFLSGHGQVHIAVEAVKQGAMDFLEKPVNNCSLLKVVTDALERSKCLVSLAEDRAKLTGRECETLDLLMFGFSSKDIASELDISVKTVEYHRYNIKSKIELGSYKRSVLAVR
ncbi:response regulator transcription factor [Vibrio intestinalis]|uniref:response regulator transcription factor n=1 Tax=Vibrio intestinalis TaxID=2933291 RepID=UPI0021A7C482|nr:response regulator [Vibrio intestinalis]